MARRLATINDLGLDLLQNIVSRLPALSFAYADCVSRSWNHACRRVLCRPKLSSACSFNPCLEVAVEEVVNKVLSEPMRPQFAILSIHSLYILEFAHELITAKLSSKVPVIVNHCHGVIGRDALSDEFKETSWEDIGIVLTVGFVPGLKVKPVSLLKQIEDPRTFMIDEFITDIWEFSTSVSGCHSPAAIMIFSLPLQGINAVMEKLDFGMSSETVIVGDFGCGNEETDDDLYVCGIQQTFADEHVVAVALVFVMDRNKPPGTGETRFHAVLSNGLSPVGPTYKVISARVDHDEYTTKLTGLREGPFETSLRYDFRHIGVTKRRESWIGQEDPKWMTSLSFHAIMEEVEDKEFVVVDGMDIKAGDTYRFYIKDRDTSRTFNLLRSFKQRSTIEKDNWEVCGGLIFTSRHQLEPNVAFLENFPGVTLGGTLCYREIGRDYSTTQESQEQTSAMTSVYHRSTIFFIISYVP